MKQTQLFAKTSKNTPKDEVSKNATLLIRAGFIDKLMAGVYTYLPLGLRVLKKIEQIIREEMNAAGGQEILMPSLQPKENWQKTGRWNSMNDLYKITDSSGRENALGPTHEEVIVPLARKFINSYNDLPLYIYQVQNKFRMELRAKSGILRGREFIMKDFYSFHADKEDLKKYYEKMKEVYKKVFDRIGIGEHTHLTFASGGSFSEYSHEFQTLTKYGEDTIYICEKCKTAVNKEIVNDQKKCPECKGSLKKEKKSIEVGNIFELNTKFSAPFNLTYKDKDGVDKEIVMGCYGIGLGRVMGTVVEIFADEKGIVWPENIAPFGVHLISLNEDKEAQKIYQNLQSKGIEVLYDNRNISAGGKFSDSDLIGIPYRIIVSKKSLADGGVEIKKRKESSGKIIKVKKIIDNIPKPLHFPINLAKSRNYATIKA